MRKFRLQSTSVPELNGIEFGVDDDASEDEIAKAASDAALEWISFGWEEIVEDKPKDKPNHRRDRP